MMKLLIPIDSSPVAKIVLDEVARRPWPSGTTACVLHVIDWPQLPSSALLLQAARQSANLFVMEASDKLDKAGLQASAKVLEGNPRIAVAQYAKEWGADFVLVGSHGVSGLMRFLLGSVAEAALHRSPCSVEIVRRPARDSATASTPMKILIATDGSDCAMAAVRSVAERPWPVSSQMRVVSAVPLSIFAGEMMSPAVAPAYLPLGTVETIQKEARRQAEEAVARAYQVLSGAHIKPIETGFVPVGDAREVILEQAKDWGADLIVVGSHGYRGIDRFMLGSVSESVAIHARCSVEVIRESGFHGSKESL